MKKYRRATQPAGKRRIRFRPQALRSLTLLLIILCLAACNKGTGTTGQESGSPSLGEEPVLPVNPGPTGNIGTPAPPPDYPNVDLTDGWADNGLLAEQIVYQNTFKSGNRETLSAHGAFPKTGNAAIDDYYKRYREDFERLCNEIADDAQQDERTYQYAADFTVECDAGGIYSVSRTRYDYTGGAHGETKIYCETFSAASGRLLTLDDFFTVGREQYTARMLEYVYATIDASPDDYLPEARLLAETLFPYQTFCLTMDGFSIFYPEYNIAPFTAGIVRIDIPWGAVAEMFVLPE